MTEKTYNFNSRVYIIKTNLFYEFVHTSLTDISARDTTFAFYAFHDTSTKNVYPCQN